MRQASSQPQVPNKGWRHGLYHLPRTFIDVNQSKDLHSGLGDPRAFADTLVMETGSLSNLCAGPGEDWSGYGVLSVCVGEWGAEHGLVRIARGLFSSCSN